MSRNLTIEEVGESVFDFHPLLSDTFDLPQRQAAQEAQDRELDERRLQGIAVVSLFYPFD
jgi:hypothetical protein